MISPALCSLPVDRVPGTHARASSGVEFARRGVRVNALCRARPRGALLASDDSSNVTASTFMVDSGISAAYVTPE